MFAKTFQLPAAAIVAVACLTHSGCIERSTVVKVKKDGSGIVHIRNHEQKVSITIGGKEAKDEDAKPSVPTPAEIAQMVKEMGKGVKLKSLTPSKNRSGWDGYDLLFEFADINQLVLGDGLGKSSGDAADAAEKKPADPSPQRDFRFSLNDGVLEVRNTAFDQPATVEPAPLLGAADPYADKPLPKNVSLSLGETALSEVYAKILADMRVGVFVQIDGEIESTNAIHREGNLITLVNVNVGEILDDPDATKRLKALESMEHDPERRKKTQDLANQTDGIDLDVQDPIVVRFK